MCCSTCQNLCINFCLQVCYTHCLLHTVMRIACSCTAWTTTHQVSSDSAANHSTLLQSVAQFCRLPVMRHGFSTPEYKALVEKRVVMQMFLPGVVCVDHFKTRFVRVSRVLHSVTVTASMRPLQHHAATSLSASNSLAGPFQMSAGVKPA